MTAPNTCPQCLAPLPKDAPLGLCPACLVRRGMEDTTATMRQSEVPANATMGTLPDPMSMEQLAPFFPQLELLELLGRGGMGVVYKARQKHLDRLVALKILPTDLFITPAFTERFAREAKALARLSHPRIVTIHDFGRAYPAGADPNSPTTPTLYFLLMEYVDGSNLRQLIKALSPEQALAIVPQICEALQFAHDEGVVHRDIKPENILVDKKGRVKIADFGLAKLLQHATGPADYTLTHPDKILGTLHYMAPEQLERPTEVDHRADIYSLGVVFYELLTGHLPLGRFALPSETRAVDARLDEVVLKALEREPEKRYQHASEVGTSVEAVRKTPAPQPAMPAAAPPVAGAAAPIPPAPPEATLREKEDASAKPATPPRLSRNAIAGAICGIVALVAGIMAGVAYSNIQRYFDEHARLFHEGPNWVVALWCIGLVLAGIGAVVMPLLGAIGVAQIRRAPEKLYGLRLALFDALLVPLLILDGLVAGVFGAIFFWNSNGAKSAPDSPVMHPQTLSAAPLIMGLGIWLPIIDVLIYWLVWRKLRIKKPGEPAVEKPAGPRLSRMAVLAPLCGAPAIVGMILIISAALSLHRMVDDFGNTYWGPLWAQDELIWGLITLGLFGGAMSLLGAIAVAQIRRSAEKLYGLRLALFEALLFPLLLVDTAVAGFLGGYRPVLLLALSVLALGSSVFIYWRLWKRLRVPARDPSPFQSPGTQPFTTTPSPVTSPFPPAANPLPAAAISPVPLVREPKRFYAHAFGLYTVAWVLPLLLWNLGWAGFILSVGIFAWIAWLQARYLQKFRPEIVAARAAEPRWIKAMRPSTINVSFTLAFVLLFLSLALQNDSRTDPDIANIFGGGFQTLSETSQGFLKGFQADDPKRLSADVRDLSLRDAMATFPNGLTYNSTNKEEGLQASLFRPIHTSSFMKELGITFSILLYPSAIPPEFRQFSFYSLFIPMGLYFFLAGFADMLSSKGYKFSGLAWKPAMALTALLMASFLVVSFVSAMVFSAVRSSRTQAGQLASFHATNPIVSNSGQAAENLFPALDRWALDHGYEIAAITNGKLSDTHRLPEVPMGVTYRAAVLWKPGLFDRLGMNWEGIYVRAPKILVQAANTDHYSEISFDYPLFSGNYASSMASNAVLKDLDHSLKDALATTKPGGSGIEMHGTKSVAPTPEELTHILAELPKPFTQDLTGSAEHKIKELGTKVWAFDFDYGPASFWIAVHEEGQKTFPERLPDTGPGVLWRVEKPKAHILMWLQPREEVVQMSPQALWSVRKQAADLPDYTLGIDVDGQAILRHVSRTLLSKPQIPLWFGWMNRELQESSGAIDLDSKTGFLRSRNQAMVFIRAAKTPDGTPAGKQVPPAANAEFGLWYLPDNAPPLPATQPTTVLPPSDANHSKLLGFWRTDNIVPAPGREPAIQELWFAPDGTARVGTTVRTKGHYRLDGDKIVYTNSDGKFVTSQPFHFDGDQLVMTPTSSDPGMQGGLPMTLYRFVPGKAGDIVGTCRTLSNFNGPPRLGNGAVTIYFDKESYTSDDLDFDVPELAMKYSIQGNHLYYRVGDGPVLSADVDFVADIGLSLNKFTVNGGKFTYYQRDKLGIGDPAATQPAVAANPPPITQSTGDKAQRY